MKNIYLIGSSHISSKSIEEVRKGFENIKPEIVAVELDNGRLYALKHKPKQDYFSLLKEIGFAGFIFFLLGRYIQKKLGKVVSIDPGSEMIEAIKLSKVYNSRIVLMDQDIRITLRKFSKGFKKREIFNLFKDMFSKEKVSFDISSVPTEKTIEMILKHVKKRFPSLFRILIDERDRHMAKVLFKLSMLYPEKKILAVAGAGHMPGIKRYLKNLSDANIKTIEKNS